MQGTTHRSPLPRRLDRTCTPWQPWSRVRSAESSRRRGIPPRSDRTEHRPSWARRTRTATATHPVAWWGRMGRTFHDRCSHRTERSPSRGRAIQRRKYTAPCRGCPRRSDHAPRSSGTEVGTPRRRSQPRSHTHPWQPGTALDRCTRRRSSRGDMELRTSIRHSSLHRCTCRRRHGLRCTCRGTYRRRLGRKRARRTAERLPRMNHSRDTDCTASTGGPPCRRRRFRTLARCTHRRRSRGGTRHARSRRTAAARVLTHWRGSRDIAWCTPGHRTPLRTRRRPVPTTCPFGRRTGTCTYPTERRRNRDPSTGRASCHRSGRLLSTSRRRTHHRTDIGLRAA